LASPLERYLRSNSRYLPTTEFQQLRSLSHNASIESSPAKYHKYYPTPQSMKSVEENRRVLKFIRKMHGESMERDMRRVERYHRSRLT